MLRPGSSRLEPTAHATYGIPRRGESGSHVHYASGTRRIVPPEQTWEWIRPVLAQVGVTRVADVTGLDVIGIPVFQAIRPSARTVSVSQGKGLHPMSARVSSAMEAIEVWHAEQFHPDEAVMATPREMLPDGDVRDFDPAARSLVHADLPMPWCAGVGLLTGRDSMVPTQLITLDHTYRETWRPALFRATSNGLASGNSVIEATAHGLAELIERDSLAALRDRPVDEWTWLELPTITDPDVRSVLRAFERADTAVEVVVAHTDPWCFEARIHSMAHPVTYSGAGCHLDATIALVRALTEAAQSRLTGIAGARDDLPEVLYRQAARAPKNSDERRTVPWRSVLVGDASDDLVDDTERLASVVAQRTGTEPVQVVLPSPHGIPVVKIIGAGLRFDDRPDISRAAVGGTR